MPFVGIPWRPQLRTIALAALTIVTDAAAASAALSATSSTAATRTAVRAPAAERWTIFRIPSGRGRCDSTRSAGPLSSPRAQSTRSSTRAPLGARARRPRVAPSGSSNSSPLSTSRQRPSAAGGSAQPRRRASARARATATSTSSPRRNARRRRPPAPACSRPSNASGRRRRRSSARQTRCSLAVSRVGGCAAAQRVQRGAPRGPVDRPAVVGIHERERPQLVALVDVGHARGR